MSCLLSHCLSCFSSMLIATNEYVIANSVVLPANSLTKDRELLATIFFAMHLFRTNGESAVLSPENIVRTKGGDVGL